MFPTKFDMFRFSRPTFFNFGCSAPHRYVSNFSTKNGCFDCLDVLGKQKKLQYLYNISKICFNQCDYLCNDYVNSLDQKNVSLFFN